MILFKDKKVRTLILIMGVLVAVGLMVSRSYYQSINDSYDPRVVPAKKLYSGYNTLAEANDFEGVFLLLDSIETIYNSYPHYKNSYEVGVLYNNRAAVLLTLGMYKDSILVRSKYFNSLSSDTLFYMAQSAVDKSIAIYELWLKKYKQVDESGLEALLRKDFTIGLENYSAEEIAEFEKRRLTEIQDAQTENLRRLSVSNTNKGIIFRNREQYELAVEQYKKAIDLWDQNMTAQNNLNVLLGRPLETQGMIERLFPPEK